MQLLRVSLVAAAALALDGGLVVAQLAACDTTITNNAIFSENGLVCSAKTTYSLSPALMPNAVELPRVCSTAACTAFFAELSATVFTDCQLKTLKLKSELLDKLPTLCAPYNASTNGSTPSPTSSNGTDTTSSVSGTTEKVFKVIGWIIGVLVLLCLVWVAWAFFVVLAECVRGCYRCLCCISVDDYDKDELVLADEYVESMEMGYENIDRPQEIATATTKTTSSKGATTRATQSTGTSSMATNSASTASGSASEAAVWTLMEDDAIQRVWIPLDHVQAGDILSHGAYGEVLRGVYDSEPVAIKRLLPARRHAMKEIAMFLEEAKTMSTLRHENIVRLIGVTWNNQVDTLADAMKDLSIVCELMEGGDLRSMLSHADTNNAPTGFHSDNIKIAIDIANALTYMHGIKPSAIVHRDLKSKNVLLTRDLHAKLTDFGTSREQADMTMTAGVGSFLWMAPEIVFGRRYDEKADVFSFGVLLSELDTHKLPYSHAVEHGSDRKLTEMMIVKMVSEGSLSVAFSSDADAEVVELARACVATSALLRPSAEAVLRRLMEIGERMAQTKPSSMLEDTNAFSLTTTRRMY